jgi:hypothetical protein
MPRPPDLIPPSPAPSRRGGRRPGAGAKPGNLNAFKHGRHSRFRDLLEPPAVDPLAVADRLLIGDRQQAERIAASFLRVLLDIRYKRDVADAVANGTPLPAAPIRSASKRDHERVAAFLRGATAEALLSRGSAEGKISPNNPALQQARRAADRFEQIIPVVAALLDRAAHPALPAAAIAALLQSDERNHQSPDALLESGPAALRTLRESKSYPTAEPIPSNPSTLTSLGHEARTLIQELASQPAPDSRHRRKKQRIDPAEASPPQRLGEGPGEGAPR